MTNHLARFTCLVLLVVTVITYTEAIPAFVPAKSERSKYGIAPIGRSKPQPNELYKARMLYEQQLAAAQQAAASKYPVQYLSNVSDYSMFEEFQNTGKLPEPIRGKTGASTIGTDNPELNRQNPDSFAPPNSDAGTVPQAKWPLSLSHNRLQNGGWARQQNIDVLPVATDIAGVQMRLEEGAYRELHWHSASEWAYILNGTFRVAAIDEDGKNQVSDVGPGDLWYFAAGRPHSIQSISAGGGEFLLAFDNGSFSEDDTLLLSDFVSHIPREVLVKNFPGFNDSDFDQAPGAELYIFPGEVPAANDTQQVSDPQGSINSSSSITYKFSQVEPTQLNGGTVKIVDSRTFGASTDIAAAEITIEPGAMRELHWHPTDEWNIFLSGHARITVFLGNNNARTFDYQAGDVGYISKNSGHFVENLGSTDLKYLEIFKTSKYVDFSLSNWLALTPKSIVKAHLGLSDQSLTKLEAFKTKNHQIVPNDTSTEELTRRGEIPVERMVAGKRSWS